MKTAPTKTATIPSLRVEPALRQAAEDVLKDGETLSAFVEASVRAQVELRRQREAFIARGITALENARRTGDYFTPEESLARLDAILKPRIAES